MCESGGLTSERSLLWARHRRDYLIRPNVLAKRVRRDYSSSLNLVFPSMAHLKLRFSQQAGLVFPFRSRFPFGFAKRVKTLITGFGVRETKLLFHEHKLNPHCGCSPGLQQLLACTPKLIFTRMTRLLAFFACANFFQLSGFLISTEHQLQSRVALRGKARERNNKTSPEMEFYRHI